MFKLFTKQNKENLLLIKNSKYVPMLNSWTEDFEILTYKAITFTLNKLYIYLLFRPKLSKEKLIKKIDSYKKDTSKAEYGSELNYYEFYNAQLERLKESII